MESNEDALTLVETADSAAAEESDDESASVTKSAATRQSKTSRVTVKTPSESESFILNEKDQFVR